MLWVTCVSRLDLKLRIEHFDVIPSLSTSATVWKNTQHFLFDMRHILECLDTKGHKQMVNNFLSNLFWHIFYKLPDDSLDLILDLHLLELVTARFQVLVNLIIFVICIMLLFFTLNKIVLIIKYRPIMTYLDLLFLKLDLNVLVVDLAILTDVLLQFLEHALHILRWVESENSRFQLIKSNQDRNSFLLSLILIRATNLGFLIMLFKFFLNQ